QPRFRVSETFTLGANGGDEDSVGSEAGDCGDSEAERDVRSQRWLLLHTAFGLGGDEASCASDAPVHYLRTQWDRWPALRSASEIPGRSRGRISPNHRCGWTLNATRQRDTRSLRQAVKTLRWKFCAHSRWKTGRLSFTFTLCRAG